MVSVERHQAWVAAAVTLVVGLLIAYRMRGFFPDDALITLRFARNLAGGHGWTYNVTTRTAEGATSPAYTAVVAALSGPLRSATHAADVLFVASLAAIAGFLVATFNRLSAPWVGAVAAALIVACSGLLDTKALESLPFLAMVCVVLWTYASEREIPFGVACAVLVLVRGEGALLVAVLVPQAWILRRRLPLKTFVAGAVVAVPWLVYSLVNFGTVVPDTLQAKIAQGRSGYWGHGAIYFRGFFDLADPLHYRTWLSIVAPLAALGLVRGLWDARLRPIVAPLVAATVLHALAYGVLFNVPAYYWYYAWELFTLAVLAALAVGWCVQWATSGERRRLARIGAAVALTVAGVAFASTANVYTSGTNQHYVAMGQWLRENTPPSARIAATEIGTIGWFSERPIVDYLGLLDTVSIAEVRRADFVSWLERTEPDYWVVHTPPWPYEAASLLPWFTTAYRPIYTSDVVPGGYRLVVYQKVTPIAEAKASVPAG